MTAAPALTIDEPADGSTITVADELDHPGDGVRLGRPERPGHRRHRWFVRRRGDRGRGRCLDDDLRRRPVGERTATARQTVDGTTSGPVETTFTVEAGDPLAITSPEDGDVVTVLDADTTTDLDLAGTAKAGAEVRVSLGDGLTATTTADDDGTWTLTVTASRSSYTISATQTVGGTTSPAVRQVVTVQAGAQLAVTAPAQDATVTVATDDSVVDVTVRGTAQPGARIEVVLDDGDAVSTTANPQGAWSVVLTDVGTGDHTATVTQTVDGATSAPVDRDFAVRPATSSSSWHRVTPSRCPPAPAARPTWSSAAPRSPARPSPSRSTTATPSRSSRTATGNSRPRSSASASTPSRPCRP